MNRLTRAAEPRDAAAVVAILAPEILHGVAHFGSTVPVVSEIEAQIAGTGPHPFRVAEIDGRVVAFARATPWKPREGYAWTVELGVYVAAGHHRTGLGRALVEQVIDAAVATGFRSLVAGIALPNPGSVALFEALGFLPVARFPAMGWKHGAWHDVGYWVRTVGTGPPRPLSEPAR